MTENRRLVVLGLGNLVRSDDGVGVHAARLLMQDARVPDNVEVIEGETLGLALLPAIEDASHILALDLDAVNSGAAPGAVVRFEMSQLKPLPGSPSVHQLAFADLNGGPALAGQSLQEDGPARRATCTNRMG